jgi:hypothetical protein
MIVSGIRTETARIGLTIKEASGIVRATAAKRPVSGGLRYERRWRASLVPFHAAFLKIDCDLCHLKSRAKGPFCARNVALDLDRVSDSAGAARPCAAEC